MYGWGASCAPNSPDRIPYSQDLPQLSDIMLLKHKSLAAQFPAFRNTFSKGRPPPKTFIHNHRMTMDPCIHPAHFLMHGQFLSYGTGPNPKRSLVPVFTYSPSAIHDDITVALPNNWVEDVPREVDPPFLEKPDDRLHWRGRNTGIWHGNDADVPWSDEKRFGKKDSNTVRPDGKMWWLSHRNRFVDWANKLWEDGIWNSTIGGGQGGNLLGARVLYSPPDRRYAVGEQNSEVSKVKWAPAMADVAFVDQPLNCEGIMCERLTLAYEFRKAHGGMVQGKYKYVMDVSSLCTLILRNCFSSLLCQIDGNGWSSRFKRLITSNSLIFKSTIYPEWYTAFH